MKKIVSMVGVTAMVITLGVGSSYAQQATTGQVVTGKAVSADVEKPKTAVAKPEGEVKADKAAPLTRSVAKDPGVSAKAGTEAKPELTAPAKPTEMKPSGQAKPEEAAPVKPSEKALGNMTSAKSSEDAKAEKTVEPKPSTETKSEKDSSKASDVKASDKTEKAKPAKQ